MKSGLDGRNNKRRIPYDDHDSGRLNEVRPRWPEQWNIGTFTAAGVKLVSMKSGLDGRNNVSRIRHTKRSPECLNEVRPRWPEQSLDKGTL